MLRKLGMLMGLAAVAAASLGGVATASTIGPTRVGPHQWFVGEVNGTSNDATVNVVCPGPSTMGRALPGQTLAVSPSLVILQNSGNTGAKGRKIVALIGPAVSTAASVVFTKYNSPQPFPTTVPVPCSGTGTVSFVPLPGSPGAKTGTVSVSYVNIGTGP